MLPDTRCHHSAPIIPPYRTYTKSDFFTAGHAILGIMLTARTLSAALTNPAILRDTWFIFLVLAVNLSSCLGTLLLIHCFPAIYHARRHEFTIANRLLRLGGVVLQGVCRTTPASQAAVGSSMSRQPGGGLQGDNRSVAQVALLNLTRPLYFSPVILLGHVSCCATAPHAAGHQGGGGV